MTTLGHLNNQGQVTSSVEVSPQELGTNCWSPSRFLGGTCDIWHDCKYPEKQTCKAEASRPATKKISMRGESESVKKGQRQERVKCWECGIEGAISNFYKYELYDTPWDDTPRIAYLHKRIPAALKKDSPFKYIDSCSELLDDHSWADFRYFECVECQRMICEQNPRNGWHTQYRYWGEDGDGEQICLRCYEKEVLENGIPREKFENEQLPGMFFSGDNSEPLDAGYEKEGTYFVGDATPVCAKALELIDSGHKVVVGYESMAIGGLEGTVSLFYKKEETPT